MRTARYFLTTLAVLLTVSCSEDAVAPCTTCTFVASIEQASAEPMPSGGFRLTVRHLGDYKVDRSIVHIAPSTPIYLGTPGGIIRGSVRDLLPGRVASFTTTDVELRSDPRQVFATAIELLPLMPVTDQASRPR